MISDNDLQRKMEEAGFTKDRVEFHAELVKYIEQHFLVNEAHICGSYSEGWGCNLSCMNGTVSEDSDVDITILVGPTFHVEDCVCGKSTEVDPTLVMKYENGHVTCGYQIPLRTSPVTTSPANAYQPKRDFCYAHPVCDIKGYCDKLWENLEKYPKENEHLIDTLKRLVKHPNKPFHVVEAQRPGHDGEEYRLSCTFLETEVVRSFNTIVGRTFVLVKYIFKRELTEFNLKSYMAKTLMMQVMNENMQSVIELTQFALNLFISNLKEISDTNSNSKKCMSHFFQNADIFFKRKESCDRNELISKLKEILEEDTFQTILRKFYDQLKPVNNDYYSSVDCLLCMDIPNTDPYQFVTYANVETSKINELIWIFTNKLEQFREFAFLDRERQIQMLKNSMPNKNDFEPTETLHLLQCKQAQQNNNTTISDEIKSYYGQRYVNQVIFYQQGTEKHQLDFFEYKNENVKSIYHLINTPVIKLRKNYNQIQAINEIPQNQISQYPLTQCSYKAMMNNILYENNTNDWYNVLKKESFHDFQEICLFALQSNESSQTEYAMKIIRCLAKTEGEVTTMSHIYQTIELYSSENKNSELQNIWFRHLTSTFESSKQKSDTHVTNFLTEFQMFIKNSSEIKLEEFHWVLDEYKKMLDDYKKKTKEQPYGNDIYVRQHEEFIKSDHVLKLQLRYLKQQCILNKFQFEDVFHMLKDNADDIDRHICRTNKEITLLTRWAIKTLRNLAKNNNIYLLMMASILVKLQGATKIWIKELKKSADCNFTELQLLLSTDTKFTKIDDYIWIIRQAKQTIINNESEELNMIASYFNVNDENSFNINIPKKNQCYEDNESEISNVIDKFTPSLVAKQPWLVVSMFCEIYEKYNFHNNAIQKIEYKIRHLSSQCILYDKKKLEKPIQQLKQENTKFVKFWAGEIFSQQIYSKPINNKTQILNENSKIPNNFASIQIYEANRFAKISFDEKQIKLLWTTLKQLVITDMDKYLVTEMYVRWLFICEEDDTIVTEEIMDKMYEWITKPNMKTYQTTVLLILEATGRIPKFKQYGKRYWYEYKNKENLTRKPITFCSKIKPSNQNFDKWINRFKELLQQARFEHTVEKEKDILGDQDNDTSNEPNKPFKYFKILSETSSQITDFWCEIIKSDELKETVDREELEEFMNASEKLDQLKWALNKRLAMDKIKTMGDFNSNGDGWRYNKNQRFVKVIVDCKTKIFRLDQLKDESTDSTSDTCSSDSDVEQ